jgi:transcriptional regulator with XRE-family HTH domain
MKKEQTPSDVAGARVREVRQRRGLTVEDCAAECAKEGAPELTRLALYKIEGSRAAASRKARRLSVDELFILAKVLNVAPVHLLVPPDESGEPYRVTPATTAERWRVRGWIRGHGLLVPFPSAGESREFFAERPGEETETGAQVAVMTAELTRLAQGGAGEKEIRARLRSYLAGLTAHQEEDQP